MGGKFVNRVWSPIYNTLELFLQSKTKRHVPVKSFRGKRFWKQF